MCRSLRKQTRTCPDSRVSSVTASFCLLKFFVGCLCCVSVTTCACQACWCLSSCIVLTWWSSPCACVCVGKEGGGKKASSLSKLVFLVYPSTLVMSLTVFLFYMSCWWYCASVTLSSMAVSCQCQSVWDYMVSVWQPDVVWCDCVQQWMTMSPLRNQCAVFERGMRKEKKHQRWEKKDNATGGRVLQFIV